MTSLFRSFANKSLKDKFKISDLFSWFCDAPFHIPISTLLFFNLKYRLGYHIHIHIYVFLYSLFGSILAMGCRQNHSVNRSSNVRGPLSYPFVPPSQTGFKLRAFCRTGVSPYGLSFQILTDFDVSDQWLFIRCKHAN